MHVFKVARIRTDSTEPGLDDEEYFASAAILLSATATSAADAVPTPNDAPIPAETTTDDFEWTGGYVGLQGGYGWLDGHFEAVGLNPLDGDFDGSAFGAFAGLNKQFDNSFVIAIEGDLEHNCNEQDLTTDFGTFSGTFDWQGSIRARVGYASGRSFSTAVPVGLRPMSMLN